MAAAGSLRTPLFGTAMRSTGGLLGSRWGQGRAASEVGVDVVQRQAAGEHEDLPPVEQLADLLRRPLLALVLGGHPGLRRLLDDLLARRVHAVADRRDRAGGGV